MEVKRTLDDMAGELEGVAASLLVLGSTIQPIQRPEGNPSAVTTETAILSIYNHILRVADDLNELQKRELQKQLQEIPQTGKAL